jgi:hypothetical protein
MAGATRIFVIDRSFAVLSRWAPWAFIAFALLSVALPFLPDENRPSGRAGIIGLSVFGGLFFGLLAWYGFRTAKNLPQCSVSVDEDGIWPTHQTKEQSLIQWRDVHSTKERAYLQRLDLLDTNGNVLMKIEYQLTGFEMLRALLVEKVSSPPQSIASNSFRRRSSYHLFNIGGIAGFSALGIYSGSFNPILGYGVMAILVALIVHEYVTTVSGLDVLSDRLRFTFPLKALEVFRAEVEAVRIGDTFNQGARHPEVGVFVRGKSKPFRLAGMGIGAVPLHQILAQWKDGT